MARALIVGCGCRGRALGAALRERGWQVRGTSRDPAALATIEAVGIEPVLADPDRVATLADPVEGVAVICWLLGSASGEPELLEALCGQRLERLLEEIVDTPVRGFVYESGGGVPAPLRERGAALVAAAGERWRIPFELVDADPLDHGGWREAMLAASGRLIGG